VDNWYSFVAPVAVAVLDTRIQAARAFARQFSNFEWKYLCSYRWFLKGVDRGLRTGDFLPLQRRAEDELVNEGLRRRTFTVDDELRVCHSAFWFD
jgi:hypothetical protein